MYNNIKAIQLYHNKEVLKLHLNFIDFSFFFNYITFFVNNVSFNVIEN